MAVGSPKAASTPKKIVPLKSRRSIKDDESVQSPIYTEQNFEYESQSDQYSNDEEEEIVEEEISEERKPAHTIVIGLVITFIGVLLIKYCGNSNFADAPSDQPISTILLKQFPLQGLDFWINIEVAVKDITNYEQPKCIIFLYENDAKETVKKILNSISEIASKELSPKYPSPLILTPIELNTEDNLNDYGKIITKNKESLEERRVMIIKNLEKVSEISVQAFHSFCDEYTPVIKKALFLFTVNVPKLPTQPNEYLRNYLRLQWKHLHEEKFAPLFTRLSSSVLSVIKE